MSAEPEWLVEAGLYIGLRDLPGAPTTPTIAQWMQQLAAWWQQDEVPWSGVAVAAWMQACDIALPPSWYRARAWLDWGTRIASPVLGAVAVFDRARGGHVGLLVGKDPLGRLLVLGGNQGGSVGVLPFERARVSGYRWPPGRPLPRLDPLPIIDTKARRTRHHA